MVQKTDEEWQKTLTPEQFHVLREHGTERAGTSPLNVEKREGIFTCGGCGQPLFTSDTKYESGSGWPSFYRPIEGAIATTTDRSHGMTRVEVHCAKCDGHLGHVFPDGPKPTGERYCMNGVGAEIRAEIAVIVLSKSGAAPVGYAARYGESCHPGRVPRVAAALLSGAAARADGRQLFDRRHHRVVRTHAAARRRRLGGRRG